MTGDGFDLPHECRVVDGRHDDRTAALVAAQPKLVPDLLSRPLVSPQVLVYAREPNLEKVAAGYAKRFGDAFHLLDRGGTLAAQQPKEIRMAHLDDRS